MWEVKSFMSQSCCHLQHVFLCVLQHPRKETKKSGKKNNNTKLQKILETSVSKPQKFMHYIYIKTANKTYLM